MSPTGGAMEEKRIADPGNERAGAGEMTKTAQVKCT
jgi:hypothetical protein